MISDGKHLVEAEYTSQVLPEYAGNPFIEALPAIWPTKEVVKKLAHDPSWHDGERDMDAAYRFHCIGRLFRYFQPLDTHIDIEQRISKAIRQGYIGKNPLLPAYARQLGLGFQMIQERSEDFSSFYTGNASSCGFTIIGMSGVGKTTGVERILSLYPQAIQHTSYDKQPLVITQLAWVKIDCPFDGSLKGLCLNFFIEVDRILGTDYLQKFLKGVHTIDALLARMAQTATLHGLGLLVIDEIQHLSLAKSGGSDKMLNFFVTLVNTIGVPVILIGTTKALSVLQGDFRQARRGSGQGDLLWDRMENGPFWNVLIQNMWRCQWTRKQVPLTNEIKEAIYDESQGILDIAVKLYAMAQIKAIATRTENFDAQTIRDVAAEKLQLVRPMLDALRSGDKRRLAKYEDIQPISIEDYAAAYSAHLPSAVIDVGKQEIGLEEQAFLKLLEMDVSTAVAKKAVGKALRGRTSGQPLADVVRKAFKIALSLENEDVAPDPETNTGDIRDKAYEELKAAGMIAEADEF